MRFKPAAVTSVIVALSAVADLSTTAVLEACGFDHYLSKPLDLERLTQILEVA